MVTANLAAALRGLGYVQRFGVGLPLAKKLLGSRLDFEVKPGYISAIIRRRGQ